MNDDVPTFKVADSFPVDTGSVTTLARSLRRWLEKRESSHLTPIDPTRVHSRPLTAEEQEARNRRLSGMSSESKHSGFRLVYRHPPPQGCGSLSPVTEMRVARRNVQTSNPKH